MRRKDRARLRAALLALAGVLLTALLGLGGVAVGTMAAGGGPAPAGDVPSRATAGDQDALNGPATRADDGGGPAVPPRTARGGRPLLAANAFSGGREDRVSGPSLPDRDGDGSAGAFPGSVQPSRPGDGMPATTFQRGAGPAAGAIGGGRGARSPGDSPSRPGSGAASRAPSRAAGAPGPGAGGAAAGGTGAGGNGPSGDAPVSGPAVSGPDAGRAAPVVSGGGGSAPASSVASTSGPRSGGGGGPAGEDPGQAQSPATGLSPSVVDPFGGLPIGDGSVPPRSPAGSDVVAGERVVASVPLPATLPLFLLGGVAFLLAGGCGRRRRA